MKKRWLRGFCAMLMTMCMMLPMAAGLASAEKPDGKQQHAEGAAGISLSELFAGGGLRLESTQFSLDEMMSLLQGIETMQGGEEVADIPIDAVQAAIDAGEIAIPWISVSPDGNRYLCMLGEYLFVFDRAAGTVTHLRPNDPNNLQDPYDSFAKFMRSLSDKPTKTTEIAKWSPDSRYIVFKDWVASLLNMQLWSDLYVADVEAGTMSYIAAYPTKPIEGGASVIQACFSEDSSQLYFTLYGMLGDYRATLNRYTMETGRIEELTPAQDGDCYGDMLQLVRLQDNVFANIMDSPKAYEPRGIYTYTRSLFGIKRNAHTLPATAFIPYYIEASSRNGYGILHFSNNVRGLSALSVFHHDSSGIAGADRLLIIKSPDQAKAETIPLSDLFSDPTTVTQAGKAIMSPAMGQQAMVDDSWPEPENPMYAILSATLSPDGEYALLWLYYPVPGGEEPRLHLVMLELATLAMQTVELAGIEEIGMPYVEAIGRRQGECVWAEDNTVMLRYNNLTMLYRLGGK